MSIQTVLFHKMVCLYWA